MTTPANRSLFDRLGQLVGDLGSDGGAINPSVYDTAQTLRCFPQPEQIPHMLDWLITQQHADGGWGDPLAPRARDVPTLASALALHAHGRTSGERERLHAALEFLRRQATQWDGALPEDLPVGIELLLPQLLEQASDLPISHKPFAALQALGNRRRRMIASRSFPPGTPPLHSWEAWGHEPDTALLDGSGGVGHSPAATARWMRASEGRADLAEQRAAAMAYLDQAAQATGVPYGMPTVWPITRFEQSFALYFLLITGLLHHPALRAVVAPQLDDLERSLRPDGLGMSDHFMADGDDTAAALAVLAADGRRVPVDVLMKFAQGDGDGFVAYHGELQHAISVTAHAAHALEIIDGRQPSLSSLLASQGQDGRWMGDKWNQSWFYTTSQALVVLGNAQPQATGRAIDAILSHQYLDGGWGTCRSTAEETAYAMIALHAVRDSGGKRVRTAIQRGKQWLLTSSKALSFQFPSLWMGKELYTPYRIVHILVLAAIAQATIAEEKDQLC